MADDIVERLRAGSISREASEAMTEAANEITRLRADLSEQAAPAAAPMSMALCEAHSVVLRVGQPYTFRPIGDCETCARMAADAREAYGPSMGAPVAATPGSWPTSGPIRCWCCWSPNWPIGSGGIEHETEGWRWVPVEPTEAQMLAGEEAFVATARPGATWAEHTGNIYRAMLAASPHPAQEGR